MANPPRSRKRIHAIPRAPDGSAFKKCHDCGVLVAITLADMHVCGCKVEKDVKIECRKHYVAKENVEDQPRSAFRFFMEEFIKYSGHGDPIDVDWKGFETWKNLSTQEKLTYELQAAKVNLAYVKALLQDVEEMKEDDGADSATVGKFDQMYDAYEDQCSDYSSYYDGFASFHTFDSFSSF